MKAVQLMFDSLNKRLLPNYGCDWTHMPNFKRLEEKCVTFDNCYAGSLPCMPARRELHTGRYNFLHRSWGPLEPFDNSAIEKLKESGIYTHITSDHLHYWKDGGSTYHTKYNSWQMSRGQEGDPWIGQVSDPEIPNTLPGRNVGNLWRQDWINRRFTDTEEKMPQTITVDNGIDFIKRNHNDDNWFLQIEVFDPHEPFFTTEKYKSLYPHIYNNLHIDWPDYGKNKYDEETTEHIRMEYAALLSQCDTSAGKLLDIFDEHNLWEDTMLIINTDHGFMLGEKEWMGKNVQPLYGEIVNIPLFIYDPRHKDCAGHRESLAQTIDIPATLLNFFNIPLFENMDGQNLEPIIQHDKKIREAALFGMHGGHINITDGKYTLMKSPLSEPNIPLYEYTLMPAHLSSMFSPDELKDAQLVKQFNFTKNCPVLKIECAPPKNPYQHGDMFFDLSNDPHQENPAKNEQEQARLAALMKELMKQNDAPPEQYERFGL